MTAEPHGSTGEGRSDPERREAAREALTMALYVCLSLQAVLLTMPMPDAESSPAGKALTLFLTALGLLAAHVVAFRLSSKYVNRGTLDPGTLDSIRWQLTGGLPVAVIAALPVLLLGASGMAISEVALLGFVSIVGYQTARMGGANRVRAWMYVVGLVAVIGGVLVLKILVH